jgi:putative ABC transport system ATP-binding protein
MDVAKLADRTIEVLDGKLVNAGENSLLDDKINVD